MPLLTNADIEIIKSRDGSGSLDLLYLLKDREEHTRLLREVLKREHRLSHESDCEGEECTCGLDALLAEIGDAVHP